MHRVNDLKYHARYQIYSFALTMPSTALCADPLSWKYSLVFSLATFTAAASSTVLGTLTALSNSPCTPFSTSSRSTRRRVLPDRVLGIMPLPWMMPPSEAMAPTCLRTSCWISAWSSLEGTAWSG